MFCFMNKKVNWNAIQDLFIFHFVISASCILLKYFLILDFRMSSNGLPVPFSQAGLPLWNPFDFFLSSGPW